MESPESRLTGRLQRLVGKRPVSLSAPSGGYSNAYRRIVRFDDGSSCFFKAGLTPLTARFLRAEYDNVYSRLHASFLPELLAWDDDGETPLLVLEDLSHALWPPPWDEERIYAVLGAMQVVRGLYLPGLPRTEDVATADDLGAWDDVAADPAPFLSLGLCSSTWLDQCLLLVLKAAHGVSLHGDDVCHFDLRSDNMCFEADRFVLVDWNWASRGNALVDLAFWLPSLHAEGGPPPEAILPDQPGLAALVSGFFAARAGLPVIPQAPGVREVQLQQLRTALPWAVRALGLPPLDGPRA